MKKTRDKICLAVGLGSVLMGRTYFSYDRLSSPRLGDSLCLTLSLFRGYFVCYHAADAVGKQTGLSWHCIASGAFQPTFCPVPWKWFKYSSVRWCSSVSLSPFLYKYYFLRRKCFMSVWNWFVWKPLSYVEPTWCFKANRAEVLVDICETKLMGRDKFDVKQLHF